MTNLINISSVAADKLPAASLQVVARWKETANKPVAAANRVRAVILPDTIWRGATVTHDTPAVQQSLSLVLTDAVADLAKSYLSAICEESNWQRTQVNEDAFSLASLLQWQQEQAALSGRLNGDEIKAWLAGSVTIASVTAKHGAAIAKALGEQLVKLASPNHGLTPEKAGKLLASIWQADDADSTTGLRVQLRLSAIRDKSSDAANMLDSIL